MRTLLFSALLALSPFFLAAQSSIVGGWEMKVPAEDGSIMRAKLSFDAEGNYSVDFNMDAAVEVRGKYQMDGNRITLWDVEGEFACPSAMKGVYDIEFTDEGLVASLVSDDCPGRKGDGKPMPMKRL